PPVGPDLRTKQRPQPAGPGKWCHSASGWLGVGRDRSARWRWMMETALEVVTAGKFQVNRAMDRSQVKKLDTGPVRSSGPVAKTLDNRSWQHADVADLLDLVQLVELRGLGRRSTAAHEPRILAQD